MLEVLDSEGVRHVFGNPGSTELPFVDALASHPSLDYVLALQEATAVGMADGYAQASGRPAFLNLHTSAGLGNAIGNLTNAMANRAPLVVTAGNADRRHLVADPLLSGDLVGLARGTVKWGHEVRHPGELGTILRRAFRDAASAPAGPVFVSIPMDVLDQEDEAPVLPVSPIERGAVAGGLDQLAAALTAPGKLALVAGEEVGASPGGVEAMVAVAALARYDSVPMHPMAAAHAVLRALPPDITVVDEAITTGSYVRGLHHNGESGSYFFCRGGGLGWGMPAALGVSLARDASPV